MEDYFEAQIKVKLHLEDVYFKTAVSISNDIKSDKIKTFSEFEILSINNSSSFK